MITEKTVFILGAGANKPYGYPTGKELRNYICNNFIVEFIKDTELSHDSLYITKIKEIVYEFSKSTNKSIDLFLTRNPEYEELGKQIIAYSIIKNENKSNSPEKLGNDDEDWFSELFDHLTDELIEPNSYSKFKENNFSIITFNYDRSLEYFLFQALNNSFTKTKNTEIAKILLNIPIIHVYGKIADLPWEQTNSYKNYKNININSYIDLANNINVIYSNRLDEERIKNAKELIINADRIFFLGFGFAPENMRILDISKSYAHNTERQVYATAYKYKDKEIDNLHDSIKNDLALFELCIERYGSKELIRNYL